MGSGVGKTDWYRNESWSAEIEAAFAARLRRARDKAQYLRIQASYLTQSHPTAALDLLDRYFRLGPHFDTAQAHVDCAAAHLALGNVDGAVASYEAALEREQIFPQSKTNAYLAYAVLVATRKLSDLYARVLDILDAGQDRLTFPKDRYLAYGARALIWHAQARTADAAASARQALAAAAETQSGFRYHPQVGLVERTDDVFGRHLEAIARERPA